MFPPVLESVVAAVTPNDTATSCPPLSSCNISTVILPEELVKVAIAVEEEVPLFPYLVAQAAKTATAISPIAVLPEASEVVTVFEPTVNVNNSSKPTVQIGTPPPVVSVDAAARAVSVVYLSSTAVSAATPC
jgi:hypothetical protein